MLSAFKISGTSHLHIFLGKFETILSSAHQLDSVTGFLAHLLSCHQDAIRLLATSSHPASELVQLAQAEPFGTFDHHYRCIRDIHSHFDHRGGYKDVCPSGCEGVHVELLHVIELLAVDDGSLIVRERELLHYFFRSGFKTLVVKFFCLVDQRIYYEYLSAEGYLVAQEFVQCRPFPLCRMYRLNWLSSRGQFIDYGNVQISVKSHCQSAGDRGGCHYQHVGRCLAGGLAPKLGSLFHAETMLFVDYCQSEIAEHYIILYQGMRSDDYSDASVLQPAVDFSPFRCLAASGQQRRTDSGRCKEFLDILEMLLCKNLCRGHYAGLVSVADGNQGSQYGHHCLSAADISLKQTVHLVSALHVLPDLGYHSFLCSGQREWQ